MYNYLELENRRLKVALKKAQKIIQILDTKIVLYQIKDEFDVEKEALSAYLKENIQKGRIAKKDKNNHNVWKYYAQEIRMKGNKRTQEDDIELGRRILKAAGIKGY
jgi:hypothetical protein